MSNIIKILTVFNRKMTQLKLSESEKINMLFNFVFSENKIAEEEYFWNSLNDSEIKKLKSIKKDKVISFEEFKSKNL